MGEDERWRWAALGGVLGPAAFVTAWLVCGALADGYSSVDDAISDLAAVDAPTRWAMTAGFLAFTLGTVVGATALRRALDGRSWVGVATTGLATAGVAATPLGRSEAMDDLHGLAAAIGYASFALAATVAIGPLRRAGHRRLARFSVVAAAVGGTCLALSAAGGPNGLFQRAGLTMLDAWLVTISLVVLRGRLGPRPQAGATWRAREAASSA